jgi:tRNA(fMet)-specific endonuclease VapC
MPMAGRYLLDTNILIALFADEPSVREAMQVAEAVFVPVIALGELYFGARKSGRMQANVDVVDDLAAESQIVSCDLETARHYAAIKEGLRRIGQPIPENDLWIAALANQYHLTLVTRDGHFAQIAGLNVEPW